MEGTKWEIFSFSIGLWGKIKNKIGDHDFVIL